MKPRRWFRFSLRTMFVLLTVFGVWLGWEYRVVAERNAVRRFIEDHGGAFRTLDKNNPAYKPRLPWVRRLLGDEPAAAVLLPFDVANSQGLYHHRESMERAQSAFPEAEFRYFDQ